VLTVLARAHPANTHMHTYNHTHTHTHTRAHTQVAKGYGSVREALLVNAKFVVGQLEAMNGNAGVPNSRSATPNYRNSPFGEAMAAEVRVMCVCVCVRVCVCVCVLCVQIVKAFKTMCCNAQLPKLIL